jgi:hypothetical protein
LKLSNTDTGGHRYFHSESKLPAKFSLKPPDETIHFKETNPVIISSHDNDQGDEAILIDENSKPWTMISKRITASEDYADESKGNTPY